jgi:hypothetical protein
LLAAIREVQDGAGEALGTGEVSQAAKGILLKATWQRVFVAHGFSQVIDLPRFGSTKYPLAAEVCSQLLGLPSAEKAAAKAA